MDSRIAKIQEIAARLNIPPQWLEGIIAFESNYNPLAKNPIPYNKKAVDAGLEAPEYARGLIQFINDSAAELGYQDSLDLVSSLSTFDSQMDNAVYPYLKKYMPFRSEQDFYMSVFYPKYRRVPPTTVFSDTIQRVNPGIVTVQDYINRVNTAVASRRIVPAVGAAAVVLAGVAAYLWMKG